MAAGRKTTLLDHLDDSLRDAIDQALRSHANEKVTDIYDRFGLAQRDVARRSFYHYARNFRNDLKARGDGPGVDMAAVDRFAALGDAEMVQRIRRFILVRAIERLEAGDTKGYEDVAMLSRIQEYDKIEIQQAAEARAEELHQIKLEALTKELRDEVDKRSPNGESMGREEVYDLIDRVMRGEEAA